MALGFLSCCEDAVQALTAMASEQKGPEMERPSRIAGTVLLTTPESFTGDIASSAQQKAGTLGPPMRESEMAGFAGPERVTGGPPVVRSSIARFKTMTPSRLPIPRSPFLTIPPGLSPTTLLDSPVLLSTGQAEPSPTTGSFPLPPLNYGNASITVPLSGVMKERSLDPDGSSFFIFKPFPSPRKNSLSSLASLSSLGPFEVSHQQTVAQVHTHAQLPLSLPQSTVPTISASPEPVALIVSSGIHTPSVTAAKLVIPLACKGPTEPVSQPCSLHVEEAPAPHSIVLSVHPLPMPDGSSAISVPPFSLPDKPSASSAPPLSFPDRSSAFCVPPLSLPDRSSAVSAHPPPLADRPSEDGYNWRKYGQKQVKGSEYPRSYYKCTYPKCHVKKKVERSHDGQVTEIVYKGEHNHAKPQVTRRAKLSGNHISDGGSRQSIKLELKADKDGNPTIFVNANGAAQGYYSDPKGERMPDLLSNAIVSSCGIMTAGPSLESTSDDEGDGEISKTEDVDDDEPDSKRRKMESTTGADLIAPFRTIREPRVAVQTTSDVDILDDGYRWRKYGQKVVKGNPYPRSYYKCTNLGCSVRKHVERSPTDAKAVITTYEGKHNHDVPAGRNNNHDCSGSVVMSSFPRVLPPAMTSVNISATRPAPLLQDQYVLGKLLEERLKAHETGSNFDSATINSSLGSKQQKGCHEGLEDSSKISGSSKGSVMNNIIPFDDSESSSQVTILRPKEEQVDGLIYDSSLPSGFSSCSSFRQVVQHRIIL